MQAVKAHSMRLYAYCVYSFRSFFFLTCKAVGKDNPAEWVFKNEMYSFSWDFSSQITPSEERQFAFNASFKVKEHFWWIFPRWYFCIYLTTWWLRAVYACTVICDLLLISSNSIQPHWLLRHPFTSIKSHHFLNSFIWVYLHIKYK